MSVIPLTIFFSLLLAGLFVVLFIHEQRRRRFASTERDSLLPLADEQPHVVGADPPVESVQPVRHSPASRDDGGRPRSTMAANADDGEEPESATPPISPST